MNFVITKKYCSKVFKPFWNQGLVLRTYQSHNTSAITGLNFEITLNDFNLPYPIWKVEEVKRKK